MREINVTKIIEACDRLQRVTIWAAGYMHCSARAFDACMRMFDRRESPAEAVTFSVFFNTPVLRAGEATIHRDGSIEMRTI